MVINGACNTTGQEIQFEEEGCPILQDSPVSNQEAGYFNICSVLH